jgi:uncharacterized protein (DUF302 family)
MSLRIVTWVDMVFDYTVTTSKDIDQCIMSITAVLREEGFGVLGVLDFQAVLKQKGVELGRDYRLMEVCNPQAAKTALDKDIKIGLLLPCTIAVYTEADKTTISLLRPSVLLDVAGMNQLEGLGKEIETRLKAAVDKAC